MKIKLPERFMKKHTEIKPRHKRKIKPRWIVIGVVVVALAFFILRPSERMPDNLVSRMDLTELVHSDIEYTINATGTVESNQSHKVYAGQNYRIENVLVEVGDIVHEGQQLLVLDTGSLEDQIETKEISMTNAERSAAQQIKAANDTYVAARNAILDGTNSSLISADSSVRTAYENWQKAIRTRDNYLTTRGDTQTSAADNARKTLENAESTLNSAKSARDTASAAVDNADHTAYQAAVAAENIKKGEFDTANAALQAALTDLNSDPANSTRQAEYNAAKATFEFAEAELNQAQNAVQAAGTPYQSLVADLATKKAQVDSAQAGYDQAKSAYDTIINDQNKANENDTTLSEYTFAIDTSYAAYETALKSQTAAIETAQNSLQQNRNSLATAQINANTDLSDLEYERMLRNLTDAEITAEESGTITAVFASIGNVASGILFVIEDTSDLVIETTISEYDVGTIKVGMPVAIRSEATKDTIYDGTVISIAPTSNKNVQGNTDKVGDAVFATKIKVNSPDTELRIGMSVRLNFIVERQENILAVPYDTVYLNDAGEECIMVLEKTDEEETYLLREIPVQTGLENDFSIVVSGEGIIDGITVINTPSNYRELVGREIQLTDQMISSGNSMNRMMFGY